MLGIETDEAGRPVLRLAVTARPIEGAANAALVKYLAKLAGVPKSRVTLLAGDTARSKRLQIEGDPAEIARRLGLPGLA
jgi:uncharacterized protein YggU (UPF0235/DUF167 family)